jgi:hypothetical protein
LLYYLLKKVLNLFIPQQRQQQFPTSLRVLPEAPHLMFGILPTQPNLRVLLEVTTSLWVLPRAFQDFKVLPEALRNICVI